MYRVLGARQAYAARVCLFCNYCHRDPMIATAITPKPFDHLQLKYRSTISTVTLSSVGKRKLKKKTKKYAELLEVTNSTTNNIKAAVQNLNAAQLSVLVEQPDITLDKLHKIKGKKPTKKQKNQSKLFATAISDSSIKNQISNTLESDLLDIDNSPYSQSAVEPNNDEELLEELHTSGVVDNAAIIKSSALAESLTNNSDEHVFKDDTIILEKSEEADHLEESEEKIIDKERKAKEAIINEEKLKQMNKMFLAHIDVCVNSNHLKYGSRILNRENNKKKLSLVEPIDISVYNGQIEKLASNSNLSSILLILQNLRKYKINCNAQTYAYAYECIGRMKCDDKNKLELLKQFNEEMVKDGVSLNDVITKCKFVRDQREYVEKMVKLLNNEFQPSYEVPDTKYDCRLLQTLTEETATPSSTIEKLLEIDNLKKRLEKQIEMEINGEIKVLNIAKQNISSPNVTHWRNKLSNLEKKWEKLALIAFKRNMGTLKSHEFFKRNSHLILFPYLSVLKPEDYVRLIMRQVHQLGMGSEMYSLPFNALCRQLGVQVYKMYEAKIKESNGVNAKTSSVYLQYCDWFINRNDKCNGRTKWTLLEHEANKSGVTLGVEVPQWSANVHLNVGRFLFNIIVNDLKFDSSLFKKKKNNRDTPAFFKIFRHSGIMLKEEIKPHPLVSKLYRDSQPESLIFDTTVVPCICPPRPWVSIHSGGYIVTQTDIVRIANMGNSQWDRLITAPPKKLYPSLDSLNQLGSIPWTVNPVVLDVAIKVFQNNGSTELNMPQPPSVLKPTPPASKDATPEEKRKIDRDRMELKRKKNEMYSLWCDALYRLSLANHFRNEIFWLPHNMDFRGRVYPIPPHLNHLGSDLARSMLVFALKKPLGPRGLDWLKLHCVNLTGFKKRDPISERLKYADEIMDQILDSAEKPLNGQMWWSKSDEPWQTLAACIEIAAAMKSPNPEEYMTGFPIHQDGSCNGLQHYAALGRDQIGAESVNLYPSDRPQDVYSSVATMVDDRRREDAANGNHIAQALDGFITRKVIKQTVMTTVYGVTWFGAKLQIARQLKDINNFPQQHLWPASLYLVQQTFHTLRTMFKSARKIQDWFTDCAGLICVAREQNMEWVTPLGLPVVQPYSKINRQTKKKISAVFTPDIFRRPNVMKQKNAFAPNFVHSLDSSHMMLTSIHCEHAGITYVSVHDCYWTHPCTVEIMNKLCREQFVALHSEPILDDLSKFLTEKFAFDDVNTNKKSGEKGKSNKNLLKQKLNDTLLKVPEQGNFDLQTVLKSTYFFS